MRKKIALLCAIIMMVTTIMPSFTVAEGEKEAQFKIETSAGTLTYAVGDTVSVIAKLTSSKDISTMTTVMLYDSTKLELDASSIKANSVLLGTLIDTSIDGRVAITASDSTTENPMHIDGEIFTVNFTVKEGAVGNTVIKLSADEMYDGTIDINPITYDEASATLTIVNPCTGIKLDRDTLTIARGETAKLTATVEPADTTDKVVWSSGDDGIATVENGVVTAVGLGETTITATCGGKTATCKVIVNKATLTGEVTISGDAVFGKTLTAKYKGNADNVEYTWYREGKEMPVGTQNIYTITEGDIGKTLTVWVSDTDNFNGMKKATTAKVEKATQDAPAKPIIEAKENKIIVTKPDTKAQYRLNDGTFGTATEFDVEYNTEYTVSAYYPETATHKASAIVTSDKVTTPKAPRKLTVNVEGNGTVDVIPEGTVREGDKVTLTAKPGDFDHKFVKWEVTGVTIADETATTITFTMGSTDVTVKAVFAEKPAVSIEITGTEFTYDGSAKTPGIAPTEVDGKKPTIEYFDSLNSKLESAPVKAGTYKIKVTFTSSETSANCTTEAEKTFTIAKATKGKPAVPVLTNATSSSFDVTFVEEQEYAINITGKEPADTEWAATITTTGLKPATTYYVFTRVKGNDNYNPSEAVNSAIRTLDTYKWEVEGSGVVGENVRVGGTLPESLTGTIKNIGTGTITNIKAALSGENVDKFTLGAVSAELASNGTLNITVKLQGITTDNKGNYNVDVTVTADGVEDKIITFVINVVEKDPVIIKGIDDKTVTFNGKTQGIDLSNANISGDAVDASKLTVTYTKDGVTVAEPRDAGTYKVAISYEDENRIGGNVAQLIINKQDVTLTGLTVDNKDYKGDTVAFVHYDKATLDGKIDGTDVSVNLKGIDFAFENKNAGENKTVTNTAPITLTGADAGNYNLTNPTVELKGTITPLPITVDLTVADKTYNGITDDAKVTMSASGIIAGDDVQLVATKGVYATADAGDAVEVTVTYTISGVDKDNYSYSIADKAYGKVNKAELNVTLTAPAAVTYDGNTHGVSGVKDDRVKADEGKTLYTLTYNNNDALPVDAGIYEVTAKLTDEGSKNYNLKANTVNVEINKADMSATNKGYSVAFMLAGAQTRPLSDLQLAPANVSGKWSVAIKDNAENILDGANIDGTNLVFTVKSGLGLGDIGGFAKLDVTFTPDKNYNPVTATVTVTLAQDTYTNSLVGTLPTQVKLGDALDFSGVQLVTKFGSGAPDQTLDVTDTAKVTVVNNYDHTAKEIGVKTVTFTDKANSGITYTHTFTVVDVLEGVKLEADQVAYSYKLKEVTSIGFDGKVYAVYKSGAKKALTHADVVLTNVVNGNAESVDEARLLSTLGYTEVTLTYTENYFDGTSAAQSIVITVYVEATPAKPDGKPTAEGFIIEPIPDEGKDMKYYDDLGREVLPEDVEGILSDALQEWGDELWNEVKNSGAFSNIDDDNIVYEQIAFADKKGRVNYENGKMQITVPYPVDSDKDDEFVMIISDRAGHTETIVPIKTANGLQFITGLSDFTFAIGWYTPAPSPVLPTEPERDPEDNFWNEVYWTLLRSGQGSVITANAGYYDRVPQGVLRAVDISGNTLVINSAFGVQVVVTPGALEKLGAYRIFYPISYLKEMLKGSTVISGSGTTGITVGVLMPTTGDSTVVEYPYSMTPATAGIIPGLESAANARPVIDNADGVSVLDGAQRNDGAVIGGGMLIGLGLLALLGAAYVTMRKRGN